MSCPSRSQSVASQTRFAVRSASRMSYSKVGNVQVAQGDLTGALKSYGDDLAIMEQLARSDPGNTGWQSDLSTSYEKVGDMHVVRGDLAGALKSYRDCLAIRERLAQSDPNNAEWQHDLAVSFAKLAKVYRQSNDFDSAMAALRQGQGNADLISELLKTLYMTFFANEVEKRDELFETFLAAELALKACIHHAVTADERRLDASQCVVVEAVLRAYDAQLASLPVYKIEAANLRLGRMLEKKGSFPDLAATQR